MTDQSTDRDRIFIDFVAGAHGNFLEFVCNRFVAGVRTTNQHPFNQQGASHKKLYIDTPIFVCDHFTQHGISLHDVMIVSVKTQEQDLLPLQCISLLRAGNFDIRPEDLENNTYHKLINRHYRSMLENLRENFFRDSDFVEGYHRMADESWPRITCAEDYMQLNSLIRHECETQHGLVMPRFDAEHPHCPRDILREFFEISFLHPEQSTLLGFSRANIHQKCRVLDFEFSWFYDWRLFQRGVAAIADWAGMKMRDLAGLKSLHHEFCERQPYRQVRQQCDQVVSQLLATGDTVVPAMADVIQEAYVSAMLRLHRSGNQKI